MKTKKKMAFLNVYVRVTNLFNQFNILNVYRATGNWDDDGYLRLRQVNLLFKIRLMSKHLETTT